MFPILKEVLSPTAVNLAVEGKFSPYSGKDLILIKHSILQLFNINTEEDNHTVSLIYQHKLSGQVVSANKIKIPNNENRKDFLILAFKDAKMSILEFCPIQNKFLNVSIHYYERDNLKRSMLTNSYPTTIRVDPNQRCSLLHFYDTKLAILPFRQREEDMFMTENDTNNHQPYLPSFIIDLVELDSNVMSVLDVCFLHSYFSPTIAVLYESSISYSGTPYKPDNISLLVLSVDVMHQTYPIIFRQSSLPTDAIRLIPLPKPVGGMLIISSASIIHCDQGSLGLSLALNPYAHRTSNYPFSFTLNESVNLVSSTQVLLSPSDLLFSLNEGDLYLLRLVLDGSRVDRLNFERSGRSIIPSTACKISKDIFLLASEMADSLLIQYQRSDSITHNEPLSPQNVINVGELDELYIGSNITQHLPNQQLDILSTAYTYKVIDSFLNVGPIISLATGSSEYLWENLGDDPPRINPLHNDLVGCSGYGKDGAIALFQRRLRPKIVTEFGMSDGFGLFTFYLPKSMENDSEMFHDHLIISKLDKTLTLVAGDELKEVIGRTFYAAGPTIAAKSVLEFSLNVQIYKTGLRLIHQDGTQVYSRTLASNRRPNQWIVWSQIEEKYILLGRGDGTFNVHQIRNLNGFDTNILEVGTGLNDSPIACCHIFKDDYGAFRYGDEVEDLASMYRTKALGDDEDEEGLIDDSMAMGDDLYNENQPEKLDQPIPTLNFDGKKHHFDLGVRYFLMVMRKDGRLQIYTLPDMEVRFEVDKFDEFLPTIPMLGEGKGEDEGRGEHVASVGEMGVFKLGKGPNPTYLILSAQFDEVIIYNIVLDLSSEPSVENRLKIRFNKINLDLLNFSFDSTKKEDEDEKDDQKVLPTPYDDDKEAMVSLKRNRFHSFLNIGNHSGVFVCGSRPLILVVTTKQQLRAYPMELGGPVHAFTPFHNPNCPRGFVYMGSDSTLKLAQIPFYYQLEAEMPVRKVPLNRAPHHIVYHPSSRTYGLITSKMEKLIRSEVTTEPAVGMAPMGGEVDDVPTYSTIDPPFTPDLDRFSLDLVSPITWETVDSHQFSPHESVTSCEAVALDTKHQARKWFLCVSTSIIEGEDQVIKGKIYLFDVIDVVPEPNNPRTNHKLKLIVDEDIKGAVTKIIDINGYLVSCIGSKVIIRSLKEGDSLDGIAFIDVQIYVCTLSTIKNFILVGDAYKSVWFLGFQEEPPKLILLGKDYQSVQCQATQILINGSNLSFLVSDPVGNCFVLGYSPKNLQSFNGRKLIHQSDIFLGRTVIDWVRLPTFSTLTQPTKYNQYYAIGGTLEGSLIVMMPSSERLYKKLHFLLTGLMSGIHHVAGLNPKSFRLITPDHRTTKNASKGILDGDLLTNYFQLSQSNQNFMATHLNTTRKDLLIQLSRLFEIEFEIL